MTIPARPEKAAMLLARRIMRDVSRDQLPPEKVMLEKYAIGRGTLREALRLLEFQGIIALRPGPGGGPVLLDPDPTHLASTVLLLMQLKQAPFRTIVEVRGALEPVTSSLAAQRISEESLVELASAVEDMREALRDQHAFLEANKRFHDIIAWSSGNALFGYMVNSLLGILDGSIVGMDYPNHRRAAILHAHEEILEAIQSRNSDLAYDRMRDHIDAYQKFAERKFPDLLDQVISWDKSI
jgi:GntR family transcriptional repressor for pyruvate dehydrogenase complex